MSFEPERYLEQKKKSKFSRTMFEHRNKAQRTTKPKSAMVTVLKLRSHISRQCTEPELQSSVVEIKISHNTYKNGVQKIILPSEVPTKMKYKSSDGFWGTKTWSGH